MVNVLIMFTFAMAVADKYDDAKTGHGNDNFHCNRQCRWYHGFFQRSIQGTKHDDGTIFRSNYSCACSKNGQDLGAVPYYTTDFAVTGPPTVPNGWGLIDRQCCEEGDDIPWEKCNTPTRRCHANTYPWAKPFNQDYWADKYTTNWLCVRKAQSDDPPVNVQEPVEMHAACMKDGDMAADEACLAGKTAIEANGWQILHCGKCSACSAMHDIEVLEKTKDNITSLMTGCSSSWVISQSNPIGRPQTLMELKNCLVANGIDFSDDGRAWADPTNKPSCMDTWTDNILNDAALCTGFCFTKFIHTANTGNFAKDRCLQCDEYTSGPAFIQGAGANRRSTGIRSDIDRAQLTGTQWEQKICKVGYYSQFPTKHCSDLSV